VATRRAGRDRWLITTAASIGRAELERDLADLDVEIMDLPAVALDDEQAFTAEGPHDLPELLSRRTTCVHDIYPDSEAEPYGLS
jgi:hypothetical protein